jgi:glycosyltransferase involved in cell wall biosynthesis
VSSSKTIAIIGNQGFSLLNFRGPLIEDMIAQGHRVVAMAPEVDITTRTSLEAIGAQVVEIALSRTGMNPISDLRSLFALGKAIRLVRPDVALSYAVKPVIYGTIAAWLARVPNRFAMIEGLGFVFISRPQGTLLHRFLRRTVKELYRFALGKAERVFFLNEDDIRDFSQMGLVTPDKAILIGGIGVDLRKWPMEPAATDPITFTLVARLLRDKGIVEFVEAARMLKRDHKRLRFLLIGGLDSNPEAIARTEVDQWVAEGTIEWPGHVQVRPWLAKTSVFVLPSYREGVPRSTQEALAAGRAVITTDVPGCRDTVDNGINGFLIQPRSASALATAMRKFIDDPILIEEMGRQGRRLAEERFDVHKVNSRILGSMGL